jgi:uncharacterized protein YneF (UPF0154 family)
MESPPLWVWAIIIGVIIAGKFIYRWTTTKELAKNARQNPQPFRSIQGNEADKKIASHKYDPQNFSPSKYKDYTAVRKRGSQKIK